MSDNFEEFRTLMKNFDVKKIKNLFFFLKEGKFSVFLQRVNEELNNLGYLEYQGYKIPYDKLTIDIIMFVFYEKYKEFLLYKKIFDTTSIKVPNRNMTIDDYINDLYKDFSKIFFVDWENYMKDIYHINIEQKIINKNYSILFINTNTNINTNINTSIYLCMNDYQAQIVCKLESINPFIVDENNEGFDNLILYILGFDIPQYKEDALYYFLSNHFRTTSDYLSINIPKKIIASCSEIKLDNYELKKTKHINYIIGGIDEDKKIKKLNFGEVYDLYTKGYDCVYISCA